MSHAVPHSHSKGRVGTIIDAMPAQTGTDLGRLVTDYAVAKMCGVRRRTVQGWRERGVGPTYHRVGRSIRYHPHDVSRWLQSRRVGT